MPLYNPNAPRPPAASAMPVAEIARRLGGDGSVSVDGRSRCPCPAHNGTRPNLSLKLVEPHRLAVKCWSKDCCSDEILRAIDKRLGTRFSRPDAAADFADDISTSREADPEAAALALWQAERMGYDEMVRADAAYEAAARYFATAKPIERGDLADRYLRSRGVALEQYPAALRLHPALRHSESQQMWPCLVAKVTARDGRLTTLHRTFLDQQSADKAPIEPVRKLLGPMRGGAVRLFDPGGDTLLVGEGVETVLSALVLSAWSYTGWAAISTSGLVSLHVPDRFRRVVIAADNDANGAGLRAAKTLAKRLRAAGRRVDICPPPKIGIDWNNVLIGMKQGGAA